MSYSQAEVIQTPTKDNPNFELWLPTQAMLKINLRESFQDEDIQRVLASVTHICRDGTLWGPTLLQGPESEQTSPQGTLTISLSEEEVRSKGTVHVISPGPLSKVKVHKHGRISDVQTIQNGIVYTKLRGTLEPLTTNDITDRSVIVNDEGAFLINVVHRNGGQVSNGSENNNASQLSQQVLRNAYGAYLINTAR